MTEEQRKKEKFVERHLSPMLCDVGCSISGAKYYIDEYNSEIVELHYIGGSDTKICVSWSGGKRKRLITRVKGKTTC